MKNMNYQTMACITQLIDLGESAMKISKMDEQFEYATMFLKNEVDCDEYKKNFYEYFDPSHLGDHQPRFKLNSQVPASYVLPKYYNDDGSIPDVVYVSAEDYALTDSSLAMSDSMSWFMNTYITDMIEPAVQEGLCKIT
jgi:hypothetical protein